MLTSLYEDLSKVDISIKAIGKLLSNGISLATFASQAIIQEISLKNCNLLFKF
jgi:hypothetical protein